MPLPKRCVEPVHVSRGTIPERLAVPSELECVTNGTLANTVRQLSSLSKHAEDMFGELTRSAGGLAERTNALQARIDRLAVSVTQLDSGVEEVSLQDIQMRKAFRSVRSFQQQLFSRGTMPSAMLATYARCDRPPPLERLNEFRDDGRDARKFYTDPDYFFELWRREMLQDTERIQHDRGKRVRGGQQHAGAQGQTGTDGRAARRVRQPHSTRDRQRESAVRRGEAIMAPAQLSHYHQDPNAMTALSPGSGAAPAGQLAARPDSIDIDLDHHARQTPRLTGNGHVVHEESPYGSVGEPLYGSNAGTPRRARPGVPPPAPPPLGWGPGQGFSPGAKDAVDANGEHTPTRCALPPPPPPPASSASPPPQVPQPQPAAPATAQPPMVNGVTSPPHHGPRRTTLDHHLDHMHAVIGMMSSEASGAAPAPPPPPPAPPAPPMQAPGQSPPQQAQSPDTRPRPPSPGALARQASSLKPPRACADTQPQQDPRTDLLKAIRDGIKLRKVEKRCEEGGGRYDTLRGVPAFLDVASILARRVAVELSDTSSGPDSDSDDDEWTESRA